MYFSINPTFLSSIRDKKFKCVVRDNYHKLTDKKSFDNYSDAWYWGYEKVQRVRR